MFELEVTLADESRQNHNPAAANSKGLCWSTTVLVQNVIFREDYKNVIEDQSELLFHYVAAILRYVTIWHDCVTPFFGKCKRSRRQAGDPTLNRQGNFW